MKSLFTLLLLISGSFALADYNKQPAMPPSTEEFENLLGRELSFIRTCAYLSITQKGLNLDNSDASLQQARFLIEAELRKLLYAASSMQRDQPFFKHGDVVTSKQNAMMFKHVWHDYFYKVLNKAQEILEATAGLPRTHELERFHSSFFILFYQVTAELSKVKVHVKQAWWLQKLRPYPAVSSLFDPNELANVYITLDYLQIETPYDVIHLAAKDSLNAFLKATDNKGAENFEVQNFNQFLLLREFWSERMLPIDEANRIAKISLWQETSVYRAHMRGESCEDILNLLEDEKKNPIHPYYRSEDTGIYGSD